MVALVGSTEARELRRRIPWYGTVYNHASLVLPAITAGALQVALSSGQPREASPTAFVAALASSTVFFLMNGVLAALPVALRTGVALKSVYVGDVSVIAASLLALAPLAWLMVQVYQLIGEWAVLIFALPLYTTRTAYEKVVEIRDMFTQTVRSLASAVDAKDPHTAGHSARVQEIARDIGVEMGRSEGELEALEWGGLLHDIGKIAVPDAILLKQDKLTREERMVMNTHPVKGEEIIRPVERLKPELPIIRHHHEWYNGSGYPDHLVGEEIPILARIMHLADAYEAMTVARPYRPVPLTPEQALEELRRFTGIQFDPVVMTAFERALAKGPKWARPKPRPTDPTPPRPIPLIGDAARARGAVSASTSSQTAH